MIASLAERSRYAAGILPGLAVGLLLTSCSMRSVPEKVLEEAIVSAAQSQPNRTTEWDGVIRDLARRYAADEYSGRVDPDKGRIAQQAIARGCQDPFVRFVWWEYRRTIGDWRPDALASEGKALAEELYAHGYSQYVRAQAATRALYNLNSGFRDTTTPDRKLLSDIQWKSAFGGINNPAVPEWQARLMASDLDYAWSFADKSQQERTVGLLDEAISRRFGDGASLHLLRGTRAIRAAWRVTELKDTSKDEWTEFIRLLTTARKDLEQAWQLDQTDPNIAAQMIHVCAGLNLPRDEMDKWFRRALATGKDASAACDAKLDYLSKWKLGGPEDCVAFGRESLAHPEYGWKSGLYLWYAHWNNQTYRQLPPGYLARPEVWGDIKESLAAYLVRYPQSHGIRLDYLYHAWLARDWSVAKEQFALLDPTNLSLARIGGQPAYDAMIADLKNSAAPLRPEDL